MSIIKMKVSGTSIVGAEFYGYNSTFPYSWDNNPVGVLANACTDGEHLYCIYNQGENGWTWLVKFLCSDLSEVGRFAEFNGSDRFETYGGSFVAVDDNYIYVSMGVVIKRFSKSGFGTYIDEITVPGAHNLLTQILPYDSTMLASAWAMYG